MRELKWKTIDSKYLFKDLWFTVRTDTCQRADGKIIQPYYVYEFPEWVAVLAITAEGKIIMERQYRHALGEVSIELPGGCVDDKDENLEKAVSRELLEETGYTFTRFEYLGKTSANASTNNNLLHIFLATGGRKTDGQNLDENEEIEVFLVSMDELKALLRENKIIQSMHVTALFYALQKLGEIKL